MTATVVLVHGAFHGGWCWARVMPGLAAHGVDATAVDLPGHAEGTTEPPADLHTDAAHVRAVLDAVDGPIVLVGHSYGGAVITEAAAGHPSVQRLVYLSAVMPAEGETIGATPPDVVIDEPPPAIVELMVPSDDGTTVTIAPHGVRATFYHDCSDDDVDFATARLSPQSTASLAQTVEGAAWRDIPSTYVVCTDDRTVSPVMQRAYATRATEIVDMPTSHSPFFSQPELVVDLLVSLAVGEG
jgi:pimeloyl-ACP methyl ester carboxylesterase